METYCINLNIHYTIPNEIGEPEDGFEFRYYD